jgi:hypothetical protein
MEVAFVKDWTTKGPTVRLGTKWVVHDVHVQPVGVWYPSCFRGEVGEVRRQDASCDLDTHGLPLLCDVDTKPARS